jgi:hypothetical protein
VANQGDNTILVSRATGGRIRLFAKSRLRYRHPKKGLIAMLSGTNNSKTEIAVLNAATRTSEFSEL